VQLVDEACSSVRVQLDSQPEIIDRLERKQMTLEVEATALSGEKQDAATKSRLAEVRAQLAALREDPEVEQVPEGDPDEVPEPPAQPVTVLGDVWVLGKHRLMCGDSTSIDAVERLMAGEKADMVFTDPPYGVDYDGWHATEKRREKLANDDDVNMYDLPVKNAFLASKDEAPIYLWFADRFASEVITGLSEAGYQVRCWIIWSKNVAQFGAIGAQYKAKHEPCIYAFKRGKAPNWDGPTNEVTVWDVARDHRNEHHPTQKPTALAERAMGNHKVKLVLDLFGGSGSTLIAAENTKRHARLMELSTAYCDVIVKRWQDFTGKKATLESTGQTFDDAAAVRLSHNDNREANADVA
jgi:DNA modification methylase